MSKVEKYSLYILTFFSVVCGFFSLGYIIFSLFTNTLNWNNRDIKISIFFSILCVPAAIFLIIQCIKQHEDSFYQFKALKNWSSERDKPEFAEISFLQPVTSYQNANQPDAKTQKQYLNFRQSVALFGSIVEKLLSGKKIKFLRFKSEEWKPIGNSFIQLLLEADALTSLQSKLEFKKLSDLQLEWSIKNFLKENIDTKYVIVTVVHLNIEKKNSQAKSILISILLSILTAAISGGSHTHIAGEQSDITTTLYMAMISRTDFSAIYFKKVFFSGIPDEKVMQAMLKSGLKEIL